MKNPILVVSLARKRTLIPILVIVLTIFAAEVFCQTKKENSQWEKCQKQISKITDAQKKIEIYQQFIQKDPGGYYAKEALKRIAELETDPQKMIEIYQKFIQQDPFGSYASEGLERIAELETNPQKMIEIYNKFILEHPYSTHVAGIREKSSELEQGQEFKKAVSENTRDAYAAFIRKYPKSRLVENVREKLRALNFTLEEADMFIAWASDTPASYREFIKKYPGSKFTLDATIRLAELENCSLSIESRPEKAIVYIGPENLSSSVESSAWGFNIPEILASEEYRKGETPCMVPLEPGVYQVAVMTYDIPSYQREKHRKGVKTGISGTKEVGFLEDMRVQIETFQFKEPISIPVEGCMTIYKIGSELREKIVSFFRNELVVFSGKLYRIELKPKEHKSIDIPDIFGFDYKSSLFE